MVHMPTVNSAATPDRGSGMEHLQAYRAAGGGKHRANRKIVTSGVGRRLLIAAAVMFAAGIANSESKAQSGPFAPLAGSWSGSGTVTLDDGSTERIRCRAKYAPIGPTMELSLTCASDAYKFNLGANVKAEGGAIAGSWSEASRNISGSLSGRGAGGNYELLASTAGFNANISLKTSGNKQNVTMRADSQFRGANISLSR
ncbi:hypothetical protein BSZ22_19030 [Bradyrhizobium canariense]|uniref:Uncharacterized protein n=2 Tax=Bradyrhizobium canariense TaxID=255045 RepID=A0A1X3H3W4_9BRAD|nr:hypothetical protein BSZ22_19030 [Bradyrhizobium canariense]OSI74671.1 hypothetical protein BSZ23_30625 [Bradyrhizobium canariense]OSI83167.1 hypothetical protein BSZ24_35145 [Bradyrhizobium canariense]OSI86315.1 hypothetical protein BSZ25_29205 [Bradyrhizobium canariense]OSI98729.1 hypothetical protein BSZ16_33230 [Bradyrhizobium canariense]